MTLEYQYPCDHKINDCVYLFYDIFHGSKNSTEQNESYASSKKNIVLVPVLIVYTCETSILRMKEVVISLLYFTYIHFNFQNLLKLMCHKHISIFIKYTYKNLQIHF